MYVPDTLVRLNDEAVEAQSNRVGKDACDFCLENRSTRLVEYYNPADTVRGVDGAYSTMLICDECLDEGRDLEEAFICDGCGQLFVLNHSWDVLAVSTDYGYYCQACYIEQVLEPTPLFEVLADLVKGKTSGWKRLNNIPNKELLGEYEYSDWGDFPGHTSPDGLANAIRQDALEAGLDEDTLVYPVVTHGYQFSVVVGVFID